MSEAAENELRRAAASPGDLYRSAEAHFRNGRLEEARRLCELLLGHEPARVEARRLLALTLARAGHPTEAATELRRALQIRPNDPSLLGNLGVVLVESGLHDEAITALRRALELVPDAGPLHYNLGNAYAAKNQFNDALSCYGRAVELIPKFAAGYNNLGVTYRKLSRPAEAAASFQRAVALEPGYGEAHANLGSALVASGRVSEGVAALKHALLLDPRDSQALAELRQALVATGELKEALPLFEQNLSPASANFNNEYGCALLKASRARDALRHFDRALELEPSFAEAHLNRASTLIVLQRLEEALASAESAMSFKPQLPFAESIRLFLQRRLCDWHEFDARVQRVITAGDTASASQANPYYVLMATDDLTLQRTAARRFARAATASRPILAPASGRSASGERLRIAYVSADLRSEHPVGNSIVEVLERHDKSRFEVIGVSLSAPGVPVCPRIRAACDQFVDGSSLSDEAVASELRRLKVGVAVDLMGYTIDSRPGIFAAAPAPITVSYLGYPGTLGTPAMDYLIVDRRVVPPEHREFYDEKIVWVPDGFFPTDTRERPDPRTRTRADEGLPEGAFVLCGFCNTVKLSPALFTAWMQLLTGVEDAVLWLQPCPASAEQNLRKEAAARGVDPSRLIFASRLESRTAYLGRLSLADLFLDTWPYNGHSTARDALWAGLPVLTCNGRSFASRVAASLLAALKLDELITTDLTDYARRGLELARNRGELDALRARLLATLPNTPVFDSERLCRQLESAYEHMARRRADGLPAEHFEL